MQLRSLSYLCVAGASDMPTRKPWKTTGSCVVVYSRTCMVWAGCQTNMLVCAMASANIGAVHAHASTALIHQHKAWPSVCCFVCERKRENSSPACPVVSSVACSSSLAMLRACMWSAAFFLQIIWHMTMGLLLSINNDTYAWDSRC